MKLNDSMKKKLISFAIMASVIVVMVGILLGAVFGIANKEKPEQRKMVDIIVNARDNQVVLSEENASIANIHSEITVFAKYNDGTTEIINDYTISGFDPKNIGTQTVTVLYKKFSKPLTIVIYEIHTVDEDDVIGVYSADFYLEAAQIEIIKGKTYKLEAEDGDTVVGSYTIVDETNLVLTMNGHPIKVSLDKEKKSITWANVVDGLSVIKTYSHVSNTGERYNMAIYDGQLIKWMKAESNEEMHFVAFGGYYYDDLGNFVAYCLNEEYKLVLYEDNLTFKLADNIEPPDVVVDNYTHREKINDLLYVHTISVTGNEYKLVTECKDGDTLVRSNTVTGSCKLDDIFLVLLNDNNRKLILNHEDKTFEYAVVSYGKLQTSKKDILYRLVLIERGETYAYSVDDVSIPSGIVHLQSGEIDKKLLTNGFSNWGTEQEPYWVYYTNAGEFAPTSPIVGTYYLANSNTALQLRPNGEYTLTENYIDNKGTYKIIEGKVFIEGKYVMLNESLFSYDANTVTSFECALPDKFIVGQEIDYSTELIMRLASGSTEIVKLSETQIINLSTEEAGKFVVVIKYGDYIYRHSYVVYEQEMDANLTVLNFPNTVMLNDGQGAIDNVIVNVETNMGNVRQVDKSLITIEPLKTSEVGKQTCIITYGNLSTELTYEVLASKVETGISLEGFVTSYNQNDSIELSNAYIRVSYNYGFDERIPCTEAMVKGFTTKVPGDQVATIEYLGFTVYYSYTVRQVFEIIDLVLDEWIEIVASSDDNFENMARLAFVPTVSGTYVFMSNSQYDSIGYLFDAETGERLARNDDAEPGNLSFRFSIDLEAGKTYYLAVKLTTVNGKVSVRVEAA